MKNRILLFAFTLLWNVLVAQTNPVDSTVTVKIEKFNGTTYLGNIISDDGREILLETSDIGRIYIPKNEIKTMSSEKTHELNILGKPAEYFAFNTRYAFTNNALPIKKGDHYASISWYGPEVHFAVHKDFSVGVMSTWIGSPLALALKYTRGTANPKINYGVGALIGTSGYLNSGRGFGGLYWGMITYGDRRSNVTLSVGYGHFNNGDYNQKEIFVPGVYTAVNGVAPEIPVQELVKYGNESYEAPIIGLAGQTKVGKKASFIYDCMFIMAKETSKVVGSQYFGPQYENINGTWTLQQVFVGPLEPAYWYTPNDQNVLILMPGMRFQRSEAKAFQISLAGVITQNMSFPFPMASWFYKF